MESHQLVNQSSGVVEYYSPPILVEAARRVMGGIDLDPASSLKANETIQAKQFFVDKDNGLIKRWFGRVWLNHPFGKAEKKCVKDCSKKICKQRGYHILRDLPGNADWINKIVSEYESGNVEEACCICFASTSESWFRPLLRYPQVFLSPRTNYYLPDGSIFRGVTKGSVITYFGPNVDRFGWYFKAHGGVKVAWKDARVP